MATYNEEIKKEVRETSISTAIRRLTEERTSSTLVPREYLRNVWKWLEINGNEYDRKENSFLKEETILRWENFYDSIVTKKKASELKVAYLCGPNPLNDLDVLISKGILPENVWAFESEEQAYKEAVAHALKSKYPFIKIFKIDIKTFIDNSPLKFDLIYLDFCGPIFNRSKQKNLETLAVIAKKNALNSPGVILTNFSLPTKKQDENGFKLIASLTADYLYPKAFVEDHNNDNNTNDGPITWSKTENEWREIVSSNLSDYYGQFITRLMMDMFSYLIPLDRFMNNEQYLKMFFKIKDNTSKKTRAPFVTKVKSLFTFTEKGKGGDVITDPSFFTFSYSFGLYLGYFEEKIFYEKEKVNFLNQLSTFSKNGNDFFKKVSAYQYLVGQGNDQNWFSSERIKNIEKNWKNSNGHIFCDVFLFHQIKEHLIGQISIPYHVNVEKSKRWQYKAKETEMYMDMILFDNCRYLYDWMPTMDMVEENLLNREQNLSFRYVLDAMGKHNRWYQDELFYGTAVIDTGVKGFEAKIFEKRITIKKKLSFNV